MKRFLVFFLVGFWAFQTFGQPSVDLGLFGGAGTYFGDMAKINLNKSVNPAYGGFIRFNFNPRYALRFNIVNGGIGAEGEFQGNQWTFNKNVTDFALYFEWNYFKYIVGDKETKWTTFLFGGVGVQMYNYQYREDQLKNMQIQPDKVYLDPTLFLVDPTYFEMPHVAKPISPTIPFGLGFKFNLSKRWGLGIEGSLRKTFSDQLDDLDDPLSYVDKNFSPEVQVKYTDQWHNNDWTAYAGVHLVYKLIYGNREWTMTTPRKSILDWGIWNKNRRE